MKIKAIYILFFLTFSFLSFSQTKRVAHKSHSGKANTFSVYGLDNFGLPPLKLDSIIKKSNKLTIKYSSYGVASIVSDTIRNNSVFNNPNITLDSLKKLFPKVKLINFEEKYRRAPTDDRGMIHEKKHSNSTNTPNPR